MTPPFPTVYTTFPLDVHPMSPPCELTGYIFPVFSLCCHAVFRLQIVRSTTALELAMDFGNYANGKGEAMAYTLPSATLNP